MRKPDVFFVRGGRLPEGVPAGWVTVAPDLAVEVVSPGDLAESLEEKLEECLQAGVPVVWVIYPATRTAHVVRPGEPRLVLHDGDALTAPGVLPSFSVALRELFVVLDTAR